MVYTDKYGKTLKENDVVKHDNNGLYKVIGDNLVNFISGEKAIPLSSCKSYELWVTGARFIPKQKRVNGKMEKGTYTGVNDKNDTPINVGDKVTYRNHPYFVNEDGHLEANNGNRRKLLKEDKNYLLVVEQYKETSKEKKMENKDTFLTDEELIAELTKRGMVVLAKASENDIIEELKGRGYSGILTIKRNIEL